MDENTYSNMLQLYLHILVIVKILIQESLKKNRWWWTKPFILKDRRLIYDAHSVVFNYFRLNDHEEFCHFVRMSVLEFHYLYNLVRRRLLKKSRRESLCPQLRLAAILYYLAHGVDASSVAWFLRIGISTMYSMIPEVCKAIFSVLQLHYLNVPNGNDWKIIADHFYHLWNMPHCVGSIDGKHFRIKAPPNSGSMFRNYKHHFSVVLMCICDAYQRIIWANVGNYGSLNDAAIFQNSDLGVLLKTNRVNFPSPRNLPGSEIPSPYIIVGDGIFGLKKFLIKPFTRTTHLTLQEKVFNYRLSRARRIVECAFGTMTEKWRIFQSSLNFKLQTIESVIMAVIALHNYTITIKLDQEEMYTINRRIEDYTKEDENLNVIEDVNNLTAMEIRNNLTKYFMSEAGEVPWQWEHVCFLLPL